MKNSKLLLVSAVLIAAVEIVGWKMFFPESFQTTFDPVTPEAVDVPRQVLLGKLECGENKRKFVTITNNKHRPICLERPQSECGCIRFDFQDEITIAPGASERIAFNYEAPLKPGAYEKDVLLKFASTEHSWRIPVCCTVASDAWVQPGRLDLLLGDDNKASKRAVLHLADSKSIGRITSSHPDRVRITPVTQSAAARVHPFQVEVVAPQGGEASISFHDRETDQVLKTVPVSWREPRVIECCPKFVVWHPKQGSEKYEITIIRESKAADIDVAEKVAWVKVTNKKVVSDREVRFSVAALKSDMPKNFKGNIVQVTDKNSGQSSFLKCRI